jgi:hypothetical protein
MMMFAGETPLFNRWVGAGGSRGGGLGGGGAGAGIGDQVGSNLAGDGSVSGGGSRSASWGMTRGIVWKCAGEGSIATVASMRSSRIPRSRMVYRRKKGRCVG